MQTQKIGTAAVNVGTLPVADELEPSFGKKVKNVFSDLKSAIVGDSERKK